jgi:hypothetical protein
MALDRPRKSDAGDDAALSIRKGNSGTNSDAPTIPNKMIASAITDALAASPEITTNGHKFGAYNKIK